MSSKNKQHPMRNSPQPEKNLSRDLLAIRMTIRVTIDVTISNWGRIAILCMSLGMSRLTLLNLLSNLLNNRSLSLCAKGDRLLSRILMLGDTTLASPRAHSRDLGIVALDIGSVGAGSEFDERVKWDIQPGTLLLGFLHKVGVDASEDGLVGDDKNVFAALEFHDDGFEADDDVPVTGVVSE